MARSMLGQLQRVLYLASRTSGDVNAAERGRLPARLVKRRYHRAVIRGLRKLGGW